jgi:hypothetical protein
MVLGVVASAWCLALSMWLFVFGIVGIFFRVLERPVRAVSLSLGFFVLALPRPYAGTARVPGRGRGDELATGPEGVWSSLPPLWPPSWAAITSSFAFTWVGAILNGRKYDIGRGVPERRSSWLAVRSLRCSRPKITPRRTGRTTLDVVRRPLQGARKVFGARVASRVEPARPGLHGPGLLRPCTSAACCIDAPDEDVVPQYRPSRHVCRGMAR